MNTRLTILSFFVAPLLLAQSYTISSFAGATLPALPAPAPSVSIGYATGLAVDSFGDFYVSDDYLSAVFKIDPSGLMTVVAGTGQAGYSGDSGPAVNAQLKFPSGLCVDANGNLFIADSFNSRIREVSSSGVITTVAGNGSTGFSGDGGPATNAALNAPRGVAVDNNGNIFIADTGNEVIRKVSPTGTISTFAGIGENGGYSGNGGPAVSALLYEPQGVTVDALGNVYIADTYNNVVRKVSTAGIISTVAGNNTLGYSGDGGPAVDAELAYPASVTVNTTGILSIADQGNNVVRGVSPSGVISTIAGTGIKGYSGDGGQATSAELNSPAEVASGPDGANYVLDGGNLRIRKVSSSGLITTIAGNGSINFSGDDGPAKSATLAFSAGVIAGSDGSVYIADTGDERIRKVSTNEVVTTIAGSGVEGYFGDDGPAIAAGFSSPEGVAVDSSGNVYVADQFDDAVREVSASGLITTLAGNGSPDFSGDGGPAGSATLNIPEGVALDAQGDIYIADTGNCRVRKVSASGVITTFAGNGKPGYAGDNGPATSAEIGSPIGLTVDSSGDVYIADDGNGVIRKVDINGTITTVAGNGAFGNSGDNGPAVNAQLGGPHDVAIDASGNLLIADTFNSTIRKVSPSGIITTIAGKGQGSFGGDNGPALYAGLNYPEGIAVGPDGTIYIADYANNAVRTLEICIESLTSVAAADSTAQTLNLPITAAASCSWSAINLPSWITSATSGRGMGTLALTLAANTSGADRSAVITVNGLAVTVTQDFTSQQFADVPPGVYYFDAVDLLKATGVTTGCTASDYCPTQDVTRAEMAIFIVRGVLGTGTFTYSQTPYFTDVQPTDYGFAWIQKMYELGITTGCAPSLYCPTQSVTRAEMAVFIIRARYGAGTYFDIPIAVFFTDVPMGAYAFNYIERMKEDNITSGCTATTYCPTDPVTRGDMAIFMMRGAFNQLLPATEPVISSVTPAVITNGTSATITVTGLLTNFVQGATLLNSVPGLVVNSLTVVNATTLSANVTATATATPHPLSIYVFDPTEEAVLPNGLVVQ